MWPKLKVMLDPLDTKSTWIGFETSATKSYTKVDLIKMSEKRTVIVSGWASTWVKESGEKDKTSKKAKIDKTEADTKNGPSAEADTADTADIGADVLVQVGWDFLANFALHFFGSVGLDGRGDSVPLVGEFSQGNNTLQLPWQLFGQGWDSLMASEMPSPAFVIKPVPKSAKTGKATKIKTAQITNPGKGRKDGAAEAAGPAADLSQTAAVALAEEALGMAKASAKKKSKKRKASPQKKKTTAMLSDSIEFVEEPLPLGYKLCTRIDAFAMV